MLYGDRGRAYASWRNAFDNEFSEASLDQPEPLELEEPNELSLDDDEDVAALLGDMQEEVEV